MIRIKSSGELLKMRKAARVSAGALAVAGRAIRPGVTTLEIDRVVASYISAQGGTPSFKGYNGFPGSVCISIGDTVIHGIPAKDTVIREGDVVSVDVGAIVDGFHGDNAYTFACGAISAGAERLLRVTRESLFRGIAAAVSGGRVSDISRAVQSYVEDSGYSVVRDFVGHGVGLALHEAPEVPNFTQAQRGKGARLVPGMTLAVEPMVNEKGWQVSVAPDGWTVKTADGGLSAHFEHSIAITDNGPEILTEWQVDPWSL